jgi:ankyrin repeat protein
MCTEVQLNDRKDICLKLYYFAGLQRLKGIGMGCVQTKPGSGGRQNGKIFPEGKPGKEIKEGAELLQRQILREAAEAQRTDIQRIKQKRKRNLIRASKDGDLKLVEEILQDKDGDLDIDKRGMWENTPLICACQYGNEKIALALIDAAANVNAVNEKGCTPLLHAAVEGMVKVTKKLLEKGADPNVAAAAVYNQKTDTHEPFSPLHVAAANGSTRLVKVLLEKNADPNKLDEKSRSPLALACRSGEERAVMEILKYCDASHYHVKDPVSNKTPFELAEEANMEKALDWLNNGGPPGGIVDIQAKNQQEAAEEGSVALPLPAQSAGAASGSNGERVSTPTKKANEQRGPMTPVSLRIEDEMEEKK